MTYEHHTGSLVQAISTLEGYPQFGGVIPKLKITDLGLVDVERFRLIDLFDVPK